MSLDDEIRRAADAFAPVPHVVLLRVGVIDHVVSGGTSNGAAAFVNVLGSITQAPYLAPYAPTAGDAVMVLMVGGSPLILGPIAAGSTAISGNLNLPGTLTALTGTIDLGTGGSLKVEDSFGNPLAVIGPDGSGDVGLATYRSTGVQMLTSFSIGFGGYAYTAISDKFGNVVMFDDPIQGGLARPRIPLVTWAPYSTPGSAEPQVTAASWTTVSRGIGYDQMARGVFTATVASSIAGTTGNVQIIDQTGATIGAVQAIPAGVVTDLTWAPVTLPNWTQGGPVTYQLQVQVTAGTGWVSARGNSAWGASASDST